MPLGTQRPILDSTRDPVERVGLLPSEYGNFSIYIAAHFHGQIMRKGLEEFKAALERARLVAILPHKDIGQISADGVKPHEAFQKDLEAIDNSDLIVAIVDYAIRGGTGFEIGYAFAHDIPVVIVATEDKNRISNMYVQSSTAMVHDLRSAVSAAIKELGDW